MKAKILIPFRDGQTKDAKTGKPVARVFQAGEVIAVGPRAALFLFSSKYAEPADDEARQFCQERGYAQGAHSTPAGA